MRPPQGVLAGIFIFLDCPECGWRSAAKAPTLIIVALGRRCPGPEGFSPTGRPLEFPLTLGEFRFLLFRFLLERTENPDLVPRGPGSSR